MACGPLPPMGTACGRVSPPPKGHVDPDLPQYTIPCKEEGKKAGSEILLSLPSLNQLVFFLIN